MDFAQHGSAQPGWVDVLLVHCCVNEHVVVLVLGSSSPCIGCLVLAVTDNFDVTCLRVPCVRHWHLNRTSEGGFVAHSGMGDTVREHIAVHCAIYVCLCVVVVQSVCMTVSKPIRRRWKGRVCFVDSLIKHRTRTGT